LKLEQLQGRFTIIGRNQDEHRSSYKGVLELNVISDHRVEAKWLINNEQEQFGTGFFKDHILVINFNYKSEYNYVFKGVVVYKCLSENLLQGFWSEKHGDANYLGEETCYKIISDKSILN
jgi:hypothetical protein